MELWEKVQKFLLSVEKPGRYIGGEFGSVVKPHQGRLKFLLAFPEVYEVGISNFGGEIIYAIVNAEDELLCERAYMPWTDMRRIMIERQIPLFSLETKTPLNQFDVVGFTLEHELSYTNILDMLALGGIPVLRAERTEDDPIVIAGGTCAYNPEPLADFVDAFYIGDAEATLVPLLKFIHQNRGKMPRTQLIEALAQFEGIYVPALYEVKFADGRFAGFEVKPGAPFPVRAATVPSLEDSFYPRKPLIPWIQSVHDRLKTELVRGCGRGCRFCQAGFVYRPIRERHPQNVVRELREKVKISGYGEVSVIALSATDYTAIEPFFRLIKPWVEKNRLKFSLPSVRVEQLGDLAFDIVGLNRKVNITFAPEAGTERLRRVINKPLDEKRLFEAIEAAFSRKWKSVKLYFMVGLPTETDEDIEGIIALLNRAGKIARRYGGKIRVTISPFVPKAHTPFQWERQIDADEIHRRETMILRGVMRNVDISSRLPQISVIEGILSRGDRRLGKVLLRAWRKGAVYASWHEHFEPELFLESLAEEGLSVEEFLRERAVDEPLPWDGVDKGISRAFLIAERQKAYRGITTPPCWERDCEKCRFCDVPPQKLVGKTAMVGAITDESMYGRRPRKSAPRTTMSAQVVRIKFSATGEAKFIGHLDRMRLWERMIRAAEIPVAYTQGFTARPKLQFSPPIPVGYESTSEYVDIFLEGPFSAGQIATLSRKMPRFFAILSSTLLRTKPKPLQSAVTAAVWECVFPANWRGDVEEVMRRVAGAESIPFQRVKKEVDIKKFLLRWAMVPREDEVVVRMLLKTGNDGSGRPMEYFLWAGFSLEDLADARFVRTEILIPAGEGFINPLGEAVDLEKFFGEEGK